MLETVRLDCAVRDRMNTELSLLPGASTRRVGTSPGRGTCIPLGQCGWTWWIGSGPCCYFIPPNTRRRGNLSGWSEMTMARGSSAASVDTPRS